jgi:hypothetical protein
LDGSLLVIVAGEFQEDIALLAITAAGADPLTPFVVGEEGCGDGEDNEDAEEDFHGSFRIAWIGDGGARFVVSHPSA